jgi:hypothetical protein
MDGHRFDALTRALAAGGSRRGVLAAALGGLAAAAGVGEGGAAGPGGGADRDDDRDRDRGRRGDRDRRDGDRDDDRVAAEGRRRRKPRRCDSDAECGACGFCNPEGRCEADDARCPDCLTCNRRSLRCGGGCGDGKLCCDGACAVPGPDTCCAKPEDCGPAGGCLTCNPETGRCIPKPDGRECAGCKRCKDGACTEPDADLTCSGVCCADDEVCVGEIEGFFGTCCAVGKACADECCAAGTVCTQEDGCCPEGRECGPGSGAGFPHTECCDADERCVVDACCPAERACGDECCPDNHRCRRGGGCCARCLADGACCPRGEKCINPGPFSDNFCCDAGANQPCGDRGDGTFSECCIGGTEQCCNGTCVPKGTCCADGREKCNGTCCGPNQDCCDGACIDTDQNMQHCGACGNACVPGRDRCVGGACQEICSTNQWYTQTCEHAGTYFCCLPAKGCCGSGCCG